MKKHKLVSATTGKTEVCQDGKGSKQNEGKKKASIENKNVSDLWDDLPKVQGYLRRGPDGDNASAQKTWIGEDGKLTEEGKKHNYENLMCIAMPIEAYKLLNKKERTNNELFRCFLSVCRPSKSRG